MRLTDELAEQLAEHDRAVTVVAMLSSSRAVVLLAFIWIAFVSFAWFLFEFVRSLT